MSLTYINLGKNGRLGNQMFQIASTIGVALKNKIDYYFPDWVCHESKVEYHKFFSKKLPTLNFNNQIINIFETQFNYKDIKINDHNKIYSLNGYFQSEKYFKEYENTIRSYFTPIEEIQLEVDLKYGKILKNSCSIHIRRGDYLGQMSHHPIQLLEYYHKGVEKIYGKNIDNINFLIFSDDIDWCKKNIILPNIHFIENNINIIDMFLMSKCENNIIANSSFSWWGAWLNKNKNKKIIAPKKWFGESLSHHNTDDIIPKEWVVI
jgi:hypothetical protein